jgi:hypothetical protein
VSSGRDRARTPRHRCRGRDADRSRDPRDAPALPRPRALRRSWRTHRFCFRIRQARACFRAGANCAVARVNHRGSGTPRSSCWCGNRSCRGRRCARWPGLAVPVLAAMEVSIASSPLCAFQLQSDSRSGVLSFVGRKSRRRHAPSRVTDLKNREKVHDASLMHPTYAPYGLFMMNRALRAHRKAG